MIVHSRVRHIVAALLVCCGWGASASAQQTYPVSSEAELQSALGAVAGGDTIVLADGYYGRLSIWQGNNASVVTIEAGAGQTPRFDHVSVSASSNWTLRGLDVSPRYASSPDSNQAVTLSGSDIVFEDSHVSFSDDISTWSANDWLQKAGDGIGMGGTRITVRNNVVLNVNMGIHGDASDSLVTGNLVENFRGDGLRGLGNYTVFEYNTVKNCYAVDDNHDDGFQSWTYGSGGVGTGEVIGVVLRGNTIINYEDPNQPFRGTLQGIGCFDGMYVDWVIENNVVITDHWHGISIYGATNVRIVNNTLLDPNDVSPGPCWIMITDHKTGAAPSGCLIRNNLAPSISGSGSGVMMDHNIVVTDSSAFYVDYAGYDLRLKEGCPAVDAGSPDLAPASDRVGTARPQGAGFDIGAYELSSGSPPAAPAAPSNLVATATGETTISLTWSDNSSDESGFRIERRTGAGGTWAVIATVVAGATSHGDTGLAASSEYFYRVCATSAVGVSAWTAEASATTHDETGPPPVDLPAVVSFTAPAAGALSGAVDANAAAYDPDEGSTDGAGIESVVFELLRGTQVLATHTENLVTYDWSFDTTDFADGSYALRATATSTVAAGGGTIRVQVIVSFDNGLSADRDTDDDLLPDWWEELNGLDPLDSDTDGDGIPDGDEDTDGDLVPNVDEVTPDVSDPGSSDLSCAQGGGRSPGMLPFTLAAFGICMLLLRSGHDGARAERGGAQ